MRVAALGKKGRVSDLMQTVGRMAPEERESYGQAVNQLKDRVSEALEKKREALSRAALSARPPAALPHRVRGRRDLLRAAPPSVVRDD